MRNKGMMTLFILGACCAIPLAQRLFEPNRRSTFEVPVAVGGALVSFYSIYKRVQSDRSSEALHHKSTSIDQRLQRLSADLSAVKHQVSFLLLDDKTQCDTSEPTLAWKRIHAKVTAERYRQYCRDYPDSPYCKESEARQCAIRIWEIVNKKDPIDIHFFLLRGRPFDALRILAESSIHEAIEESRLEHRGEIWRHVRAPFYVLMPLFPLIYAVPLGIIGPLFALTAHPAVSPYLAKVTKYSNDVLSQATWAPVAGMASYTELIARMALTAFMTLAGAAMPARQSTKLGVGPQGLEHVPAPKQRDRSLRDCRRSIPEISLERLRTGQTDHILRFHQSQRQWIWHL
jgi:hypothetical protein